MVNFEISRSHLILCFTSDAKFLIRCYQSTNFIQVHQLVKLNEIQFKWNGLAIFRPQPYFGYTILRDTTEIKPCLWHIGNGKDSELLVAKKHHCVMWRKQYACLELLRVCTCLWQYTREPVCCFNRLSSGHALIQQWARSSLVQVMDVHLFSAKSILETMPPTRPCDGT